MYSVLCTLYKEIIIYLILYNILYSFYLYVNKLSQVSVSVGYVFLVGNTFILLVVIQDVSMLDYVGIANLFGY